MTSLELMRFEVTGGLAPAGRVWQKLAEAALGGYDISTAGTLPLLMIGRLGGGVRQAVLAHEVGVEGPSLVRQLDKLCAAGLVRRESDVSDRRANILWLTDEGRVLSEKLEACLTALRKRVMAKLPAEDLQAVLRFYQVLTEATKGS